MGNIYTYDEKAAYEQRYRSRPRHSKQTSYSSSNSSSSFNEKYDDGNPNPPTYSNVFYNTLAQKPLPPLPRGRESGSRVNFRVEKPLPPFPAENKRSSKRDAEDAWWANGGQGIYESDGEEEEMVWEDVEP